MLSKSSNETPWAFSRNSSLFALASSFAAAAESVEESVADDEESVDALVFAKEMDLYLR